MSPPLPPYPGARDEARLLYASASVAPAEIRRKRTRELAARAIDWEFLLAGGARHRILTLLHDSLRDLPTGMPPGLWTDLEHHERRARFRNLRLLQEMLELVRDLRAGDVEALPYKGPVLAALLYPDPVLREYRDLDLIVRKADVERAARIVAERGYRTLDPLEGADAERYRSRDCQIHFRHPDSGILLELHWEVLPRPHRLGLAVEEGWDRLVDVTVAGTRCRTFPPEDQLLILCVHGGEKHRWMRLQMLSDVARLLASGTLDWPTVLERAARAGRSATVELGVLLAWALLDAPLPEDILRRALANPSVRVQAALLRGRAFHQGGGLPGHAEWRHYQDELLARARQAGLAAPRDGILRYLGGVLTPEWNDRQSLDLPAALRWAYYLYRPVRLLRLHRAGVLRRLGPRVNTE